MDLSLTGTTVFVSGSTQGIGYAAASACAAEGASVVLNGRSLARVDTAVERLRASHPGADITGAAADLTNAAEVDAMLDTVGDIDVLVNNAGQFEITDFAEVSDDEWARTFDINVMSSVRLSRRLLPPMLARGRGRIIFIGTESAVDVPSGMIPYGATKAAALALSNGLAKLTRGTAVTVNTVLGGPTYSDGVAGTVEHIAASQGIELQALVASLIRDTSLIQRFIDPSEIADLVAFLASPRSSAINGAAIRADGGVLPTVL